MILTAPDWNVMGELFRGVRGVKGAGFRGMAAVQVIESDGYGFVLEGGRCDNQLNPDRERR